MPQKICILGGVLYIVLDFYNSERKHTMTEHRPI